MHSKKIQLLAKIFFGILIAINLISLIRIFQIPTDTKNAILWGYSLARWLLVGIEVLFLAILLYFFIRTIKKQEIPLNLFLTAKKLIINHIWIFGTLLILVIGLVFSPPYRFGSYAAYFERLNPLIDFLGFSFFLYLLFVFLVWNEKDKNSFLNKKILWGGLSFFGVFLLVWTFIIFTRIGLDIDYSYWGGAATPVLFSTILIAAYLSFNLSFIYKKIKKKRWLYILIPVILYLATCILWFSEPFTPSFFAPKPVAPNYDYYPYSDSHYYAMTAQSLLSGEGYMNRGVVQRPIYGFLLYLFNLIGGQDYFSIINLQLLLFSTFPVLIYLLGKKLNGPIFGVFVALIAMIREITAYRTTPFIEVVHSKLLMTDFLAAIFVAWICYLLIQIVTEKQISSLKLVLLGFAVGLGLMVRFNNIFLIFPILFVLVFFTQYKLRKKLFHTLIFLISCFLILFPWMYRNYYYLGEFGVENSKIKAVIDTRFGEEESQQPVTEPAAPKPDLMMRTDQQELQIDLGSVIQFASANFLHNEIHSILILPNTFELVNLEQLINENEYFFEAWEGSVSTRLILFVFVNLLILSFGVVFAVNKLGIAGMIPFFFHIFYNLSNGFGRVSGWRYVMVTDWAIYLYYALSLFSIVTLLSKKLNLKNLNFEEVYNRSSGRSIGATIMGIVILFLFSFGMILPEAFNKPDYPGYITCEQSLNLVSDIKFTNMLHKLDPCNNADKIILYEKAVFPRYYPAGKGEPGIGLPWFTSQQNAHLGFSIVGPFISGVVIEMETAPPEFTNSQEVIVIGTWNNTIKDYPYIDADSVYLIRDNHLYEKSSKINHE